MPWSNKPVAAVCDTLTLTRCQHSATCSNLLTPCARFALQACTSWRHRLPPQSPRQPRRHRPPCQSRRRQHPPPPLPNPPRRNPLLLLLALRRAPWPRCQVSARPRAARRAVACAWSTPTAAPRPPASRAQTCARSQTLLARACARPATAAPSARRVTSAPGRPAARLQTPCLRVPSAALALRRGRRVPWTPASAKVRAPHVTGPRLSTLLSQADALLCGVC